MISLKKCHTCTHFWPHGIKDGKHNKWCCQFGKAAAKALGECKLKSGYQELKQVRDEQ